MSHVGPIFKFDPNCICVFVYLHVRHSGTLFLRSSYHYLFKNISHVRSIFKFDPNCICVFVYLYLCIVCQTLGNIVFEVLVLFPFEEYSTCWVYLQIWPNCICVFVYLCIWPPNTFTRPIWPKKCQSVFFNFLIRALWMA